MGSGVLFHGNLRELFSESGLRPSAKWVAWKKTSWLTGSHQEPFCWAGRVSSVFTWSSLSFLWFPLKLKFLAEIMTCGPTFAKDYVPFYIASHQAHLQSLKYQIRTGKSCQAACSDQQVWFLALLLREVTKQGCLCQQWKGCLGSSFLGNWTTAIGELSFFCKSILNKIRI